MIASRCNLAARMARHADAEVTILHIVAPMARERWEAAWR